MSKDSVKQMFGKMEKDEQLQKKYAALILSHRAELEKVLAEKLIEFGKNGGFAFSKEDLLAARSELMDTKNAGVELSDNDLASVAGGGAKERKDLAIAMSVTTAGLGCGFASVVVELTRGSGGCGREMTTVNCK